MYNEKLLDLVLESGRCFCVESIPTCEDCPLFVGCEKGLSDEETVNRAWELLTLWAGETLKGDTREH